MHNSRAGREGFFMEWEFPVPDLAASSTRTLAQPLGRLSPVRRGAVLLRTIVTRIWMQLTAFRSPVCGGLILRGIEQYVQYSVRRVRSRMANRITATTEFTTARISSCTPCHARG